ncbi:hypothetical protein RMSM_03179 [Rhodopirellula maiorica SM1]|uniref:Uncharacterized protein n=1 Tax=Rhodopirellula maiorica SM1 TaxID=1265738 RepID=M5S147_9BACT|nr:hypothetical protein RMSM_03179 [Rhodopirellula maiorica SM1]
MLRAQTQTLQHKRPIVSKAECHRDQTRGRRAGVSKYTRMPKARFE